MSGDCHAVRCIVCGKKKQYGRLLHFFKFPYDIERCKSWVKVIGMRELLFMPIEKLREQVVCAVHFGDAQIPSNHLNKAALPCCTPYPTLSDEDMKDFPKNRNMIETGSIRTYGHMREKRNEITSTLSESDLVIDYGRPLMENLGTLVYNENHVVKKPAGILNSIAVPLMTYSSSLEKGTVFAAEDPGNTFKMPFVPFIEPTSQNEYKASKKYTNVRAVTDPSNSNMNVSPAPKLSVKQFIKTTKPMHKNTLIGKVKPNMKPVEQIPKTGNAQPQRNYNVSFGLNTLITGHPRKANKDTKVKIFEGAHMPTIKAPEQQYKNIKQYTNNRLTIKKNIPFIHTKTLPTQEPAVSLPQTGLMPIKAENEMTNQYANINKPSSHSSAYVIFEPASSVVCNTATANSLDTNDNSPASCDLTFVPYSQYESTVTPESPNAHTAEGTLDYGLPLMNCIGTVFQGNIQTTIKTEDIEDPEVIDVPLMKCLKTLENIED